MAAIMALTLSATGARALLQLSKCAAADAQGWNLDMYGQLRVSLHVFP